MKRKMTSQKLLTDLAVADKNTWERFKSRNISYTEEVRKVFQLCNVTTFFDLVQKDIRKALELRDIAVREQLL